MARRKDKEPPERRDECHSCGGFYAQRSSASCLCLVCHSFLYPVSSCEVHSIRRPNVVNKSDSEDSGTEEPKDFYETVQPPPSKRVLKPNRQSIKKNPPTELNEVLQALCHARPVDDILQDGLIGSLPEEIILAIFSYLDDISLWSASQVCERWKDIIDRQLTESNWRRFTRIRWPFLTLDRPARSWKQTYSNLILSSNCFLCLSQVNDRLKHAKQHWHFHQKVQPTRASTSRSRTDVSCICRDSRIAHEMSMLAADPLDGVLLKPLDDLVFGEWHACIFGPAGSPYEGGQFYLSVSVSCRYPMDPPVVRFLTKIFHPNVSRHGDIGLDSLQHNWSLALTLSKILLSIQSLLTDPYTRVCMEPEIGKLYRENHALYEHTARLWTTLYAKHHLQRVP
ncbi:uncharacterized protein LOC100905105 [Galendromus occidentalis]|uniref:E2 ubiquitin-conjugating enzyme n=1 Tax=Galendromus occidentalis TaxID=34638 RepID=A0AAJ6QWA2_9ACAR|nr:uncharacterized protein LOC100905105 [Galendromus occidentalis]